jgi:drug/metabolite transporter (DMT)-like permease
MQNKAVTAIIKKPAIQWDILGLFFILLACDTAAQLFFKLGASHTGEFPIDSLNHIITYVLALGTNPMVLAGIATIAVAFFCWLAIIAKVDLSKAHTVTSIAFGTVPLCSVWLLGEHFTALQSLGVILIMLGAYIASEHNG